MPLSEYEQRVLEQMERQLSADDPKLATTLTTSRGRTGRRVVVAVASVLVGILGLVLGVVAHLVLVGILGFLVMFGGVTYAVLGPTSSPSGGPQGVVTDSGQVKGRRRGRSEGFMERIERRWDSRRDEGR